MFSFRDLAARIVERARGELERDLQARAHPDVTPIPMSDWLRQLDALEQLAQIAQAANVAAAIDPTEGGGPLADFAYDDGESPDPDDPRDFNFDDFDRRR